VGTAEAERLAEEIVRQATASRGERRKSARSSWAEFRSKTADGILAPLPPSRDLVFWRCLTAPANMIGGGEAPWSPARFLIEPAEQRTLSKASNAAGGYLVPQDFDEMVTSARRARNVIGNASRVIRTDHGRNVPLPTATAHGTGSWLAENASFSASDETFGQVALNAFKAGTKVIVSEELVQDALEDLTSI
jgi:HK97 family phage major capsid protein